MHEMSILEGMVQVIEEQARAGGYERVRGVVLEVGPFANIELEALNFAFDVVTKGTLAEGAVLEVETPAALGRCQECDREVLIRSRLEACPLCREGPVCVTEGTQICLKALDVE